MRPSPCCKLIALLLTALPGVQAGAAGDCAQRTAVTQEINITSGIYTERAIASTPLKIRVPLVADANAHAECLRLEGFEPAAQARASFERAGDCRESARRTVLVTDGKAHPHIASDIDADAYSACLDEGPAVRVLPP